jgi:hypothetical protein
MARHSNRGAVAAGVYAVLCLAATAWALWRMVVTPAGSELAAMGVVLLGLPWSLVFALGFAQLGFSSAWLLLLALAGSCALNAWLIHRLASRTGSRAA